MKVIPERVTELREKLGLSQEELAKLVGVTQQAIQQVEKGKSRSPRFLLTLARELKTWHPYLVGESDDPTPPANYMLTDAGKNGTEGGPKEGNGQEMPHTKLRLIRKIMEMSDDRAVALDRLLSEEETNPRPQKREKAS